METKNENLELLKGMSKEQRAALLHSFRVRRRTTAWQSVRLMRLCVVSLCMTC